VCSFSTPMGAICGTEKDPTTKEIDKKTHELANELSSTVKVLLLGPGESGKSTIFKQLKIIQDNGGFSREEQLNYKNLVYINCVSQMRCMVEAAIALQHPFEKQASLEHAQTLMKLTRETQWSVDMGKMIQALWADNGIQTLYQKRGREYQLNDTADYFFNNIERYMDPSFVPTYDDILRVRVRSTGIEEAVFTFDKRTFRFVDVGGQRAERRKWVHCFDGVTAVLYCACLSSYDLPLREDPRQNRMAEALMLFQEIVNSDNFRNRGIIFFLNKTDLFAEKLKNSPLNNIFPTFKDGADFDKACSFVKNVFLERIDSSKRDMNSIFTHFTCALDTKNMAFVVKAVRRRLLDEIVAEFV